MPCLSALNRVARAERRVMQVLEHLPVSQGFRVTFDENVPGRAFDVDDPGFSWCTESGNSSDPIQVGAKAGIASNCPAKLASSVEASA